MAITKKIRFEIFKRDKFTCQYCGKSAPDVVLHIDHIHPKSKGGEDTILNLVTSCFDCNLGKSDRTLADDSVMAKQKAQLDQLQARREQIDMMLEWHKGLADLDQYAVDQLAEFWNSKTAPYVLNESGASDLKKWIKRFSFDEVLFAMDAAIIGYAEYDDKGMTPESFDKAFNKIAAICVTERKSKEIPYLKDMNYIRAVFRNKGKRVNESSFKAMMEDLYHQKINFDWVKDVAKSASNYMAFEDIVFESVYPSDNGKEGK